MSGLPDLRNCSRSARISCILAQPTVAPCGLEDDGFDAGIGGGVAQHAPDVFDRDGRARLKKRNGDIDGRLFRHVALKVQDQRGTIRDRGRFCAQRSDREHADHDNQHHHDGAGQQAEQKLTHGPNLPRRGRQTLSTMELTGPRHSLRRYRSSPITSEQPFSLDL